MMIQVMLTILLMLQDSAKGDSTFRLPLEPDDVASPLSVGVASSLELQVQIDPINALLEDDYPFHPDFDVPKRRVKKVLKLPRNFKRYFDTYTKERAKALKPAPSIAPPVEAADKNELAMMESAYLSLFRTVCPGVVEKYSVMLQIIDETARIQLRMTASAQRQMVPSSFSASLKTCEKSMVPLNSVQSTDRELKKIQKSTNYESIEEQLQKEEKFYALMSQKDVIPTNANLAKFFDLIQKFLEKVCFRQDETTLSASLQEKYREDGSILQETLRLTKKSDSGKKPTSHQGEVQKLLKDAQACLGSLKLKQTGDS